MGKPYRQTEPTSQNANTAYMVLVFMGNQNAIQAFRSKSEWQQPLFQLPGRESAIEQQTGVVALDQGGVAAAAATQ